MITISNKKNPHFGKKGKIVEEIKDENVVLIYIPKDEMVYQFNPSDITDNSQNKNVIIPKSRKDFYYFITKKETKRRDITQLINKMEEKGFFVLKEKENIQDETGLSKKSLFDFILDLQHSKSEIINHIRTLRDKELILFTLPNNSFNTRPIKNKKVKPNNNKRRKAIIEERA